MAGEAEVSAMFKLGESSLRVLLEILRLLREQKGRMSGLPKSKTAATDKPLAAGTVAQKALMAEARRKNYAVVAQDGITKADMNTIAKKAKEYGIPVAFTGRNDKDNIKVSVRDSDKKIFEQIMTDIVKEKLTERPNELGSFKVERQNAAYFRELLSRNDLSANFVADKNGDVHCIYSLTDKKAFDIGKAEFQKMHGEVADNLGIKQEDGYIVLSDGGKDVSFADSAVPTKPELTAALQSTFGYTEVKADLAAAKFADTLDPAQQNKFFDNSPQNLMNNFEQNIRLKDESILVREFDFYRVNLKDGTDMFVVMNADGGAATLAPEMMTTRQMKEIITARLGVTDTAQLNALADKAEKVNDIYRRDIANQKHGDYDIRRSGDRVHFEVTKDGKSVLYNLHDNKGAVADMRKDFGVDKKTAQEIFDKANKQRYNSREKDIERATVKQEQTTDKVESKPTTNPKPSPNRRK